MNNFKKDEEEKQKRTGRFGAVKGAGWKFPKIKTDVFASNDEDLSKYFYKKTLLNGDEVTLFDRHKFFVDKKAITESGAIILKGVDKEKGGSLKYYDCPSDYEYWNSYINQYLNWKCPLPNTKTAQLEEMAKASGF